MSTTITGKAGVVRSFGGPVYGVLNECGIGILDSVLFPYLGKAVKITIDPCEEMKVNYQGKDFTIRVFTDTIEIAYPKSSGDCTWTFDRGDVRLDHKDTEFRKAQFAIYHMQELLQGVEEGESN